VGADPSRGVLTLLIIWRASAGFSPTLARISFADRVAIQHLILFFQPFFQLYVEVNIGQ